MEIRNLLKKEGFRRFLLKSGILVVFLILLQFLSMPFVQNIEIPRKLYTLEYTVIGAVLIFSYLLFLLLLKDRLKEFETFRFSLKDFVIFGILGIFFYFLFFYSKYLISKNIDIALENFVLISFVRHIILFLTLLFFALAIFGSNYIIWLWRKFKKEIIISAIVAGLFVGFALSAQNIWKFLSFLVIRIVYFFLSLTFNNVSILNNETISIDNFTVSIGKVCSGIESMLLFTALYLFILFLDWKKLNIKRMLLIFIPGLAGVFLVNCLRIYLIMLIAALYSPTLARGIVHTNAGWLLFILYFVGFWWFAYGRVKN